MNTCLLFTTVFDLISFFTFIVLLPVVIISFHVLGIASNNVLYSMSKLALFAPSNCLKTSSPLLKFPSLFKISSMKFIPFLCHSE